MELGTSTVYTPSDTAVNTAVKLMSSLGKIKANMLLAYNYDAFPLLATAAKAANSTDAVAIAKELVIPSVLMQARTAVLSAYHFTAASHDPHAAASEFTFIAPSSIVNGQFGHH
jgi:branched-chain amino acid transport system substrate-binding protein